MELTIPPGCTALLELPDKIKEYTIDGAQYDITLNNEIKSGKYKISYKYTP
jgi:hypothetical protein